MLVSRFLSVSINSNFSALAWVESTMSLSFWSCQHTETSTLCQPDSDICILDFKKRRCFIWKTYEKLFLISEAGNRRGFLEYLRCVVCWFSLWPNSVTCYPFLLLVNLNICCLEIWNVEKKHNRKCYVWLIIKAALLFFVCFDYPLHFHIELVLSDGNWAWVWDIGQKEPHLNTTRCTIYLLEGIEQVPLYTWNQSYIPITGWY